MKHIVKWALKRHLIIYIFTILIATMGIFSYFEIPKQENPNTNLPAALITTIYPGATSIQVENLVTVPLENALSSLQKVDVMNSYSYNSASVIVVVFDIDADPETSISTLKDIVAKTQSSLPTLAYESTINDDLVSTPSFILSFSSSTLERSELASYAQSASTQLSRVSGVSRLIIDGEDTFEVLVNVDVDALNVYQISIETIVQLMQAQNLTIPSGSIVIDGQSINVQTPSSFESVNDIEDMIIKGSSSSVGFVRLSDVATVNVVATSNAGFTRNGETTVLLTGYFNQNVNAVSIGNRVSQELNRIKQSFPSTLQVEEVMFSPKDIDNSINNFIGSLLQSIALIIFIVMIFVKLRNALVISLLLPLSILMTFIVMNILRIEFHFISIAALIISLGILVDNGIVIAEAIQYRLNEDYSKHDAIMMGVKDTAIPMLTSTLTTMVTFGMFFFVPGVIGKTVGTIPTIVISTLTASYLVAMIIVPIFANLLFKKESIQKIEKTHQSVTYRFFRNLLEFGLKKPKTLIALAFSTLIISGLLFTQLNISFFPYSNKPTLHIDIASQQSDLASTKMIHDQVLDIIKEYDEIINVTSAYGRGLPKFFITAPVLGENESNAQVLVNVNLVDSRFSTNEELGRELQSRFNDVIVGADVQVRYLEYALPVEAKVAIALKGDDLDALLLASSIVQDELKTIQGTTNIRDTHVSSEPQYVVNIDPDYLSTSGLLKFDVVKTINTALMGTKPTQLTIDNRQIPINIQANIRSMDDLLNLTIRSSATNSIMQLRQVASLNIDFVNPSIFRQNGLRTITVLSDVLPNSDATSVELALREKLALNQDLQDVEVVYRGELSNITDLISNLGLSSLAVIALIYLILVFQFNNLKQPLIILASIPLSLSGVFLGLVLFRVDIQAMALLGAVSLIGIVVNNGILLVEVINTQLQEGSSIEEAIFQALKERYRPITLTTLTTIIGVIPLILSNDPLTSPMALVLFFGLAMSTILTMVVIPTLVFLTYSKKNVVSEVI
ncbi:MAG: efflux RND transporter permease subunit [Erysipelothrix sp.]|jgi:multidrug efflux pump subunit AcrB|nr:efflux RND transporter permease subunit [Erysipelothrix sp.]